MKDICIRNKVDIYYKIILTHHYYTSDYNSTNKRIRVLCLYKLTIFSKPSKYSSLHALSITSCLHLTHAWLCIHACDISRWEMLCGKLYDTFNYDLLLSNKAAPWIGSIISPALIEINSFVLCPEMRIRVSHYRLMFPTQPLNCHGGQWEMWGV